MRTLTILACIAELTLLSVTCYATPSIVAVEPAQIAAHKSASVKIQVTDWPPGASLALMPGGPYLKQTVPLGGQINKIAIASNQLFIAGEKGIAVYATETLNLLQAFTGPVCINIFIEEKILYCAEQEAKISIFEIMDGNLRSLGQIHTPFTINNFIVNNGLAFLLHDSTLVIMDIHDRNIPVLLSTLALPSPAHNFTLHDDTLYIADGASGVLSIDVHDKNQPVMSARYVTNGAATLVQAYNGNLFVADQQAGLVVLSINADGMQWRGSHNKVGSIRGLQVVENKLTLLNDQGDLISLDITNPALPSIAAKIKTTPGTLFFAASTTEVFTINDNALARFDFSLSAPILSNQNLDMGQGVNFGGQRKGFIEGNLLYVADWFSGLHIYDIRQPERPILLSSYHTPGSSKGVVVRDGYAFVADDDHGLQIIDVHIPKAPQLIAQLQTAGLAYTPKLVGDRLHLASHRGGVQIIDISNVAAPKLLGEFLTGDKAWSIDVHNDLAYVANAEMGLLIFDVKTPAQVRLLGQYNPGGNAEDVVVRDHYAFVTFFDQGLHIVDISDPMQPKHHGSIFTPGNARGIELDNNFAYIADWFAGVHIVDITSLDAPKIVGSYDTSGATWGVRAKGNYLFAFDWWGGLVVLNTQPGPQPILASHYPFDRVTLARAKEDFLYTAHGNSGLQIFDIKNPLNPTWITGVELPDKILDLTLDEDYAYAAMGMSGIAVIDIHNPFQSSLLSTMAIDGDVYNVFIEGKNSLFARRNSDILRIDISDPFNPRIVETVAHDIQDMWGDSGFLYLAADGGLLVQRIGTKFTYRYPEFANMVRAQKNRVCLYAPGYGISILDFSQGKFTPLSRIEIDSSVIDMQLSDTLLYVALANGEVVGYDLSQPVNPKLFSLYRNIDQATSLTLHRQQLYLATENGIVALNSIHNTTTTQAASVSLTLPPLPDGWYDIAIVEGEHIINIARNAVHVASQRFGKPKITMEQFKELLRQKTQAPLP